MFYVDDLNYEVEVTLGFSVVLFTNKHIEHKMMVWNDKQSD